MQTKYKRYLLPKHAECLTTHGFTLLEVLVATAILGIAVAVVLQLFSANLRAITLSEDYVSATKRAEAKMRERLDDTALTETALSEATGDGYRIDVGNQCTAGKDRKSSGYTPRNQLDCSLDKGKQGEVTQYKDLESREKRDIVVQNSSRGITLLELTISIALIGIIVLIITGAMRLGTRAIESGEKRIAYLERTRSSLNIIDSQIQSYMALMAC